MKGRAAQTFGSFGDRNEGSSSGLPRVAFVSGRRMSRVERAARRRHRKPPVMLPSLAAVRRALREERERVNPG